MKAYHDRKTQWSSDDSEGDLNQLRQSIDIIIEKTDLFQKRINNKVTGVDESYRGVIVNGLSTRKHGMQTIESNEVTSSSQSSKRIKSQPDPAVSSNYQLQTAVGSLLQVVNKGQAMKNKLLKHQLDKLNLADNDSENNSIVGREDIIIYTSGMEES